MSQDGGFMSVPFAPRTVASALAFYVRFYRAAYRALSRDAKLLVFAGGVNSIPFGVNAVALPVYLTDHLGYLPVVAGTVFTIQGAVAVALTIPLGIVADRFGRKRIVVLGGLFAAASFFLLPFAASIVALYAAAVCAGLAGAFAFAPLQALLAEASADEERTVVFGMSFFLQSAAQSLASLAATGPELLLSAGWDVVPAYATLFAGAGVAVLAGPALLARTSARERRTARERGLLSRRSRATVSKYFASNAIIGLGAGLVIPILSLWFLLKFHQKETFTGPLFAAGNLVNAVAFLAAPILARRYGMVRTVVTLQFAATAFLLGMAVVPGTDAFLPAASVLYLARNAAMNMSGPVSSSFLMGAVEPDERSSASAVVGVSFRLPNAISTTFGAAMMAQNPDSPLYVTTALYVVGVTAFYAFFRGVPEKRASPVSKPPPE